MMIILVTVALGVVGCAGSLAAQTSVLQSVVPVEIIQSLTLRLVAKILKNGH